MSTTQTRISTETTNATRDPRKVARTRSAEIANRSNIVDFSNNIYHPESSRSNSPYDPAESIDENLTGSEPTRIKPVPAYRLYPEVRDEPPPPPAIFMNTNLYNQGTGYRDTNLQEVRAVPVLATGHIPPAGNALISIPGPAGLSYAAAAAAASASFAAETNYPLVPVVNTNYPTEQEILGARFREADGMLQAWIQRMATGSRYSLWFKLYLCIKTLRSFIIYRWPNYCTKLTEFFWETHGYP